MASKVQAEPWENPLVPHALLQRMYAGMQALRAISPSATTAGSTFSLRGQEACRASSLLSLEPQDLISDLPPAAAAQKRLRSKFASVVETLAPGVSLLPSPPDAQDRLRLANGAASALQAQSERRLVLAYVEGDAVSPAAWRHLLGVAGGASLPVVFVLLPTTSGKSQGAISDRAQSWGVPGMPVDAADAIALYRVLQESVLRARGGDGPALIECVTWLRSSSNPEAADGLHVLRAQLRARGLSPLRASSRPAPQTRRA